MQAGKGCFAIRRGDVETRIDPTFYSVAGRLHLSRFPLAKIVAGGLAAWVPKTALPSLLRPLALLFGDSRYDTLATLISSPVGTMIFGIAIIAVASITTAQKQTDVLRAMLNAGLVFGLLAWIVIYYSLASTSDPTSFKLAWDKFMGTTGPYGCFDCRVPLATAAGMKIDHSFVSTTMAGLIMGFWIYYGYYIPTFFSEEIKKPISRSLVWASVGSLIVAYLIFLTGTLLLQRLVPSDWIAAEGYLFNNPNLASRAARGQSVVAMPWITFYAAILKPYVPLIVIVAFGWVFTLINLVQTYLFYSGRILWSWAADQVMPDWVFGPSANQASPSRSIGIVAVLALIGLADSAFSGPLGTQLTFVFFAVVTQLVPVLALILVPVLNRDAFTRIPLAWRRPILGVSFSSLLGSVALTYLLWMVVASFLYPAAGVASPIRTLALLVAFLLSGILFFKYMVSYRRKRGVDLTLTFAVNPEAELLDDARFD